MDNKMNIEKIDENRVIIHNKSTSIVYEKVDDFSECMALVKNNNGYGYINSQGVEIIPCQYEQASNFKEGVAAVLKKDVEKWGFIDKAGNETLPFIYDSASDFGEGLAAVCTKEFFGYIDALGNHILKICNKYSGASSFSEGMAQVWSMSTLNSCEVVEISTGYEIFDKDLNLYVSFKYGYIDKTGQEIIPLQFSKSEPFYRGKAKVAKNGKIGYVSKVGDEIISIKYDEIGEFSNGKALVLLNKQWGVIHEIGVELISCCYKSIDDLIERVNYQNRPRKLLLKKRGCSWLIEDKDTKEIVFPHVEDKLYDYARIVEYHDDKTSWGIINKKGEIIVPCIFDHIDFISNSTELTKVLYNGKQGFIDILGNQIIPCEYDDAWSFGKEGLAKVKVNSQWGYINKKGEIVIPCIYDELGIFHDGLSAFVLNGKIGYISIDGQMRIPCKYDKLERTFDEDFCDGLAIVGINGKYGFINTRGVEVIPVRYQKIERIKKTWGGVASSYILKNEDREKIFARVWSDDFHSHNWQFIDKLGNIISHKENIANHEQKYDSQDYERDTWDALTDGQYGDYPEDGYDIDGLLDSMGRG